MLGMEKLFFALEGVVVGCRLPAASISGPYSMSVCLLFHPLQITSTQILTYQHLLCYSPYFLSLSSGSDFILRSMPALTKEYEKQADAISVAFTGDPSFYGYNGIEQEPEDPEAPQVERFREVHRLARTVSRIDHDCSLVPRGALVVDATKKVIQNKFFEGLSYQTSGELRAYMHMRYPEQLQGIALLKKPGIIKSGDFLDCIDKDLPAGVWSVRYDDSNRIAYVANNYWSGYNFYSVVGEGEFGGCYFGNGVPMTDIAFML